MIWLFLLAGLTIVTIWCACSREETKVEFKGTAVLKQSNPYFESLAVATRALYDFLVELNDNPRCRQELAELPGMEQIDKADMQFSVNKRLAVIVFCDLRDCLRQLGYPLDDLDTPEGIGLVMLMALLVEGDFDLGLLATGRNASKIAKSAELISNAVKDVSVSCNGVSDNFRFGIIFGVANGEHDWVQRFSTLLYGWASIIAKADGMVSEQTSATLDKILKMSGNL